MKMFKILTILLFFQIVVQSNHKIYLMWNDSYSKIKFKQPIQTDLLYLNNKIHYNPPINEKILDKTNQEQRH